MKINSFEESYTDLETFADELESFINVEHRYVEGSLVLSLNAPFGSGKSTFLDLWSDRFATSEAEEKPTIVRINAWEDDYCGDALVSIVSALMDAMKKDNKLTPDLVDAAKDVGNFLWNVTGQVAKKFSGVDVENAGAKTKEQKAAREKEITDNFFDIYREKKHALATLKEAIKQSANEDKPDIIILVDELDRCRPDYAISYLETIKHVFDIPGLVFILAIDRDQLEKTVQRAFGDGYDFEEYMRKFVQRSVSLPKADKQAYEKLTHKYIEYYLRRTNNTCSSMSINGDTQDIINNMVNTYHLNPRQIQEAFRIMGHVFETSKIDNEGTLLFGLTLGTIIMTLLRIADKDIYKELAHGNLDVKIAKKLCQQLSNLDASWLFTHMFVGEGLNYKQKDNVKLSQVLHDVGLADKVDERTDDTIADYIRGWGCRGLHCKKSFAYIYSKIENVSKFAK